MPKIIHEREKCGGCGGCAKSCSKFWQMAEDGKSMLLNSKQNPETKNWELEVEKIECNQVTAEGCPAKAIHIEQ